MPGDGTDTTIALISLAGAKEQIKNVSGVTDDTLIASLINQISEACNTFCQRHLLSKALVEYYHGNGSDKLYLKRWPIITLTSLYNADSLRVFDADSLVTIADDAIVDNEHGIITLWNNESVFYKGKANIKVTYTAGYALASVPYDIQKAVRVWVAHAYKQLNSGRYGIQSENLMDRSINYLLEDIPKDVKGILELYKKPDFGFSNYSHSEAVPA